MRDSGIIATFARIDPSGFPGSGEAPAVNSAATAGTAPKIARANSERPAPTSPASPTISPARISSDAPCDAGGRQVPHRQGDGGVRGRRDLGRIGSTDGPSEHRRDERVLRLGGGRPGPDDLAVAQDRYRVGEHEDLVQEVRDEDDRTATGGEAADDLVELLDLNGREGRRRLVEDDELGLARECAQDLDLLLLGQRQCTDDRIGRNREPGADDDPVERVTQGAPSDEAEPSRLGAEEHVLCDRPLRDEGDLLGDECNAATERLAWGPEAHRLALEDQLAVIRREHSRHDLAERGLAGSVLADEGMNGADPDLERHVVKSARGAE